LNWFGGSLTLPGVQNENYWFPALYSLTLNR